MTINMPCVGCVDLNLKRPWVISCDISSEHRSIGTFTAQSQSGPNSQPNKDLYKWTNIVKGIRSVFSCRRDEGKLKRHWRINDAGGVYRRKERKNTYWKAHGHGKWQKFSSFLKANAKWLFQNFTNSRWRSFRCLISIVACSEARRLLIILKDEMWTNYFEVQIYVILFIVGVKWIDAANISFSLSVKDKHPNVVYFERLVIW